MNILLSLPLILSFFITFIALPSWIKKAKKAGLEGKDMHKHSKPKIAEMGGVIVIGGFIISVLSYIALKTFYFQTQENLIEVFALVSAIVIISLIAIIDDILGWKIGLGKRVRIFLVLIGAIPLMVINAGHSHVTLPFFDGINLGLFYPLFIIPLGIIGATTSFNFLAGYNGLESGQGIIILTALSIVAYFTGSTWLSLIGFCMVLSLFAFWVFNKYPAEVFPGDVLTYSVGALIAIMAILGDFERIAIFFFIPYILEVGLKIRGKLKKESFAKPKKDGSLEMPYKKIYSLNHLSLFILDKFKKNKKVYERDIVLFIHSIQIIIILIGFVIFRSSIF